MDIDIARIYEPIPGGTYRILVDGMWPRGIKKASTKVDTWIKSVAPSSELRKWYGHEDSKAEEFAKRYRSELDDNPDGVKELREAIAAHPNAILVYAAKSSTTNASVLQDYLAAAD